MTTKNRLARLEQIAAQEHADLVTVVLMNGERRTVQLVDVIPMLMDATPISSIEGEVASRNGMLFDLLRGVIEEGGEDDEGDEDA